MPNPLLHKTAGVGDGFEDLINPLSSTPHPNIDLCSINGWQKWTLIKAFSGQAPHDVMALLVKGCEF